MHANEHSTVREGLVIGLLGAIVSAIWYLVFDIAAGRPLYTFAILGRIFFDAEPGAAGVGAGPVFGFVVLHFALFLLAGLGLAAMAHAASRNVSLRMGVWLALVVAFCFLLGVTYALNIYTGGRLPAWEIVGGVVLAVGGMAWILWRRHPRLSRSFEEVPLGDEVETPGHAPGGPRV